MIPDLPLVEKGTENGVDEDGEMEMYKLTGGRESFRSWVLTTRETRMKGCGPENNPS